MDIEQLNKTQIVLLVLLVSFVTSIATGIVTVTLLDQAPPAVTQTINRVVERTIERVVPGKAPDPKVITKEVTVVVNEADLVAEAIEKSAPVLVRIFEANVFVGLGIMVTSDGVIATDRTILNTENIYQVMVDSGYVFETTVALSRPESPVALLKIIQTEETVLESDEEQIFTFTSAIFSNLNNIKLGQTVIALYGETYTSVSVGIISGLPTAYVEQITEESSLVEEEVGVEDNPELFDANTQLGSFVSQFIGDSNEREIIAENNGIIQLLSLVETNIKESGIQTGSPLVDIFGEVIGIKVFTEENYSAYVPINVVTTELIELSEIEATVDNTDENTDINN